MRKVLLVLVMMGCCVGFVGATELSDYGNYTTFYHNITAAMGAQTDYQVKFILSNSSGISGYYAPDNIIYTNGTTRADWFDVNATDGAGNPLPFWIENNTYTAYNATAWVKVPTIATDNSSTGRWYYGNSSQSASMMDGLNTFRFFDDFLGSAINTTQWTRVISTGSNSISGGIFTITGGGGEAWGGTAIVANPTALKGRFKADESDYMEIALAAPNTSINREGIAYDGGKYNYGRISGPGYTTTSRATDISGAYHTVEVLGASSSLVTMNIDGVLSGTVTTNIPTSTLGAYISAKGSGVDVYSDWVFIRKYVTVEPTTSLYTTTPQGAAVGPIVASFTSSSNPSTVNTVVSFTGTSTGTPTTWNWTIAGSITNTTQNAAYLFDTSGTYAVDLNVTNASGHFSNYTLNQVVTNVSGFTQQDIWMEGQYLQTFHIVDSNNLPIANVTITSTSGNSFTTSNGTGYLTEPFGAATVTFVSDGYTSRAISYVFDSDDTHSVTMYTATPPTSSNVNTLYSPQTVHLTIVDAYGVPQPGAYITVSYIASSLPSTDTNWLTTNFGVDSNVAADMTNSSVLQRDYTGSDGGFVFTAFPVIRYNITAVNATTGMNHRTEITPKDSHYVIYCPLTGQARGNNTLIARQNATLPWYSLNNTHIMLGMTYQDTTSCTSSVRFRAWFQTNGSEIHNTTWSGFGSALILDNHTVPKAPIGTEYLWQYNATRVC